MRRSLGGRGMAELLDCAPAAGTSMTGDKILLAELIAKANDGDFLHSVSSAAASGQPTATAPATGGSTRAWAPCISRPPIRLGAKDAPDHDRGRAAPSLPAARPSGGLGWPPSSPRSEGALSKRPSGREHAYQTSCGQGQESVPITSPRGTAGKGKEYEP
jgi:hypothetical protein